MTDAPLPAAIEHDEFLPYEPSAVWRALTDPELVGRWWAAAADLRPEVGHRFTLDMGAFGVQHCTVAAVEPERLLRYTFAEGVLDTTLTWTLVPEGTGTRLILRHEGFDLDSPLGRQAFAGMGKGWSLVLSRIAPVLAA
ncbi:SRPBCC domain-containing protein [Leifsonia sp. 71-9]|uniref:SRPBCC family protein n=1 Tax=Leifsonia sp. 71-9 TaxID=1895934 RepID=UPI000928E26B|nr:SRPBCC domain-containing protein [Leifsonia sp. 71-9]OJX77510.1 MAG: polyketide cyclase [Leifsonia sp. 71-9]